VEADGQGRMRADKLPRLSQQTIVCIQAGNVNTGAFDPAWEICPAAKDQGAWCMWMERSDCGPGFRASTTIDARLDRADSWSTDAHKWPNSGYDSGLVLVRDGEALRTSMA